MTSNFEVGRQILKLTKHGNFQPKLGKSDSTFGHLTCPIPFGFHNHLGGQNWLEKGQLKIYHLYTVATVTLSPKCDI